MGKFHGVAFWTVKTVSKTWIGEACQLLLPVEEADLAKVSCDFNATGDRLTIAFTDAPEFSILIKDGEGRGVVRASDPAPRLVACMIAIRMKLGGIEVVGDGKNPEPFKVPRQYDPFYQGDWLRVRPVAETLGLVVSAAKHQAFVRSSGAMF